MAIAVYDVIKLEGISVYLFSVSLFCQETSARLSHTTVPYKMATTQNNRINALFWEVKWRIGNVRRYR
jgi:hypothetical protein